MTSVEEAMGVALLMVVAIDFIIFFFKAVQLIQPFSLIFFHLSLLSLPPPSLSSSPLFYFFFPSRLQYILVL